MMGISATRPPLFKTRTSISTWAVGMPLGQKDAARLARVDVRVERGPRDTRSRALAIHVAAIANLNHKHPHHAVLYFTNNPEITHSVSPKPAHRAR